MVDVFIKLVEIISQTFIFLAIISAILSFFMSPYHPIRRAIDRFLEPFLSPIRRIVPLIGNFDFSLLVLIILIQIASFVLIRLLSTMR
jgi:YggT family protein